MAYLGPSLPFSAIVFLNTSAEEWQCCHFKNVIVESQPKKIFRYQIVMSHVRSVRVPMLVGQPFKFCRITLTSSDVLGLQVLQLAVDVVSLAHFQSILREMNYNSKLKFSKRFCNPIPIFLFTPTEQCCQKV